MVLAALRAFGAGGCRTAVLHDAGISSGAFPADEHVAVEPGCWRRRLREAVRVADAVLVIAPEAGGLLAGLTTEVQREGSLLLGSTPDAVRVAGDKFRLARVLGSAGVRIPRTLAVYPHQIRAALQVLGFPAVIKPRAGAGGEGVSVVRQPADVGAALARLRGAQGEDRLCLLQEWVPGVPASVSLIGNGRRALPLTLNRQFIEGGATLSYRGGLVPYHHWQRDAAFMQATKACASIPGLRGYVGVDVILSPSGPVVVEVNPRWTTSCVALERLLQGRLARIILDATVRGALPRQVRLAGCVRFDLAALQRTFDAASRGRQPAGVA